MSIKYKEMVSGVTLAAAPVSLYAAPSSTYAVIQAASINNPTGAPVTLNIYKVPNGLSAGQATKICTRVVPAGAVVTANEAINHKMEPASQIYADGLGLNVNISGVEYIPD